MKNIRFFALLIALVSMLWSIDTFAQYPDWLKKVRKSIFRVTTYAENGDKIGSVCGFYTDKNQGVAPYSIFRNASKAIIQDESGKESLVESVLAADDMYDIIRFNVTGSNKTPLTVAPTPSAEGEEIWVFTSPDQSIKGGSAHIIKTEIFKDKYTYYTIDYNQENVEILGSPLFNGKGEVLAMIQPSAGDKDKNFAVSVPYALTLKPSFVSINSTAFKTMNLKPALPDKEEEAFLFLTIASSAVPANKYKTIVEDFITKFPKSADGYAARSRILLAEKKYDEAEKEIQLAYSLNPIPMYKNQESNVYITKGCELIDNGSFREGVLALNKAEELYTDTLNDNFYYVREQAEVKCKMFQQALNDLTMAILLNDSNELYYAEKARVHYVVSQYDEAIDVAKQCIKMRPEYSDAHLMLGLSLIAKEQKAEGLAELRKAKELGNPQADKFLEKNQ